MDLSESLVVVNHGEGLVEVVLDSLLDGVGIVIRSATGLGSLHASLQHDILGHIVEKNLMGLDDMVLEVNSLIDCSGESINQVSLGGLVDKPVDQDLDSQLEGDESSLSDDLGDLLSIFGFLNSK